MSLSSDEVGVQINNSSSIPIARFGNFPDGSTALKISDGTVDVTKAPPGNLIFDSTLSLLQAALVGDYTFPAATLGPNTNTTQIFKVAHGINGVPGFLVYYSTFNNQTAAYFNFFPENYYTQLVDHTTSAEPASNNMGSSYGLGIDSTYLYIGRSISNDDNSLTFTASPIFIKYYVYQQTIT